MIANVRGMIRRWVRSPRVRMPLGAVGVLGLLMLLLGPVTFWATAAMNELNGKDKADAVTATRQILLAAAAGVAAVAGLAYTARNFHLSRRGQLTDRFGKAIGQLASDRLAERLGGIYALENIMVESARDHAAFIRERTTPDKAMFRVRTPHVHRGPQPAYRSLSTDVQAALTVLGRRPPRPERNALDLRSTDLCGADLSDLRLDGANLWGAYLQHTVAHGVRLSEANLSWAQLQDSRFGGAVLSGASLYGTRLQEVTLNEADLTGAQLQQATVQDGNLRDADLRGAKLSEVNLRGVIMNGADLRGADLVTTSVGARAQPYGLTARQLALAVIDGETVLPAALRRELTHHHRQRLHRALLVHLEQRQL